jgi:ketosteroid isomerase-like protein
MSQENVEIVRRGMEAFARGDLSQALEVMSDDLETWRGIDRDITWHGKDGYLALTAEWAEGFADWTATAEEFIDAGDLVVVRVHQTGRGEASGVPVEGDFWFVNTLQGGKIVRLEMYASKDEALEAAGLSE